MPQGFKDHCLLLKIFTHHAFSLFKSSGTDRAPEKRLTLVHCYAFLHFGINDRCFFQ